MAEWFRRMTLGMLICGVAFFGCLGGDDDETPTGAGTEGDGEEAPEELTAFTGALVGDLISAFSAIILSGGDVTLTDSTGGGTLEIVGETWSFENYSPDGQVFIDGALTVIATQMPIPISGELTLTGAIEGEAIVDMEVSMQIGQDPPYVPAGTITFNGVTYDVTEMMANAMNEGD